MAGVSPAARPAAAPAWVTAPLAARPAPAAPRRGSTAHAEWFGSRTAGTGEAPACAITPGAITPGAITAGTVTAVTAGPALAGTGSAAPGSRFFNRIGVARVRISSNCSAVGSSEPRSQRTQAVQQELGQAYQA